MINPEMARLVSRYREEDSPALHVDMGLLRMLDEPGCKSLEADLEEHAGRWEIYTATDKLADALPDEPGLYMFVWRPPFQFRIDGPSEGTFPQILYIGQAGGAAKDFGNTIRARYKDYRKHLRGNAEELWTQEEPTTRSQRLSRYLSLRPLEFWCATTMDRSRIENLEKRLIRLHNPPLNQRSRPKLRGKWGTPRAAWQ